MRLSERLLRQDAELGARKLLEAQVEIERLRVEMHRIHESRRGLREEIGRLEHRAAYAEKVWKELGTSREQLQGEVERLTTWQKEAGDLIGRQVNELTDLHNENVRLRAEASRLRAIIDEIAAEDDE